MLVISAAATYVNRRLPCPTDPQKVKSCMRVRRLSAGIFFVSLAIYAVGFFFAFVASRIV